MEDFACTTSVKSPEPQNSTIRPLVMNDVAAAAYLGMSPNTLRKWRTNGSGPAYICCGRLKKYRLADLESYIEKQAVSR